MDRCLGIQLLYMFVWCCVISKWYEELYKLQSRRMLMSGWRRRVMRVRGRRHSDGCNMAAIVSILLEVRVGWRWWDTVVTVIVRCWWCDCRCWWWRGICQSRGYCCCHLLPGFLAVSISPTATPTTAGIATPGQRSKDQYAKYDTDGDGNVLVSR